MYWKAYLSLLMISDITFYALLRFVLPQELFFVLFCNFKVSSVIIFNIKYTLSYFDYWVFVEMYFKCIFEIEIYFNANVIEILSYQDYSRIPLKEFFIKRYDYLISCNHKSLINIFSQEIRSKFIYHWIYTAHAFTWVLISPLIHT